MGFNLIAERRRDAGVMPCIFFVFYLVVTKLILIFVVSNYKTMKRYRFKTESEFKVNGHWNNEENRPYNWSYEEYELLGKEILDPSALEELNETEYSCHYNGIYYDIDELVEMGEHEPKQSTITNGFEISPVVEINL